MVNLMQKVETFIIKDLEVWVLEEGLVLILFKNIISVLLLIKASTLMVPSMSLGAKET